MIVVLIVVTICCYLGVIGSIVVSSRQGSQLQWDWIIAMCFVFALNLLSAKYLNRKASTRKVEWALFGLIGNINAIFIYWLYKWIKGQWQEGKHIFGDGKEEVEDK